MGFFYIYVLLSVSTKFIYVGFTSNVRKRLNEHNLKQVPSTKYYAPLRLIHYEAYLNRKDAIRREKYLKTSKGKTTLRTMLMEHFQAIGLDKS